MTASSAEADMALLDRGQDRMVRPDDLLDRRRLSPLAGQTPRGPWSASRSGGW